MTSTKKTSRVSEKKRKALEEEAKKEIMAMDFDEFKKSYLESYDTLEQVMTDLLKWNADQHDLIANTLAKEIRGLKKWFEVVGKRLHDLEAFVALMAITNKESLQKKPMSFAERKNLASCVSIKWGKVEEKAYNARMQ